MKLSIITINYNNAEGLRKTLASVAAQTYPNIEHIIVDGNSTDNSVDVIREYAEQVKGERLEVKGQENSKADTQASTLYTIRHIPKKHNVLWVSEPDKGIYNAMNKGIEIALGKRVVNDNHISSHLDPTPSPLTSNDYIQILNSGDTLFDANVTENMVNHLIQSGESIGILYGNMIKEYPNGKKVKDTCLGDSKTNDREIVIRETEWTMYDFIKGTINHDPTYIHYSLYEKYGLYDDTLKIVSDWKWFAQSVVFGEEKVFYIPINVTIFDMTGISETNLLAREVERHNELKKMLPPSILKDYEALHFPISQYKRLKKYRLWTLIYIIERVLFKLEKWGILSK